MSVSYTHLDVYKRQVLPKVRPRIRLKDGMEKFTIRNSKTRARNKNEFDS